MEIDKNFSVQMFDGEYQIIRITDDQKKEKSEFDTLEEAVNCCKKYWKDFLKDKKTIEKFLTVPGAYFGVFINKNGIKSPVFDMLEEERKGFNDDENNNNN